MSGQCDSWEAEGDGGCPPFFSLSPLGSEKEGPKLLKLIVINLNRLLLNDPGDGLGEWWGHRGS